MTNDIIIQFLISFFFFSLSTQFVTSIDFESNDEADQNIVISDSDLDQQESLIVNQLTDGMKFDSIVCVAGGWVGGNASSKDFLKGCQKMINQSLYSSLLAARLASLTLKSDGLLCLTGAKAAVEATPSMIGYGISKNSVHFLTKCLSSEGSGLPSTSTTLAILPVTLDTKMNRKFMPSADFKSWTPLDFVADLIFDWSEDQKKKPSSGSLVSLVTSDGVTQVNVV